VYQKSERSRKRLGETMKISWGCLGTFGLVSKLLSGTGSPIWRFKSIVIGEIYPSSPVALSFLG
jgi:hypothetical protein